jgi:hypothetical protein
VEEEVPSGAALGYSNGDKRWMQRYVGAGEGKVQPWLAMELQRWERLARRWVLGIWVRHNFCRMAPILAGAAATVMAVTGC